MGLSELVLERGNSADQINELVGHMVDSAKELDNIIRDITTKAQEANQKVGTDVNIARFQGLIKP
jgi:hypothetical protein